MEKFPDFARALKTDLPESKVLLAGFPGEHESTYREAGMDDFIFIKSNHYGVNAGLLKDLGVLTEA